MSFAEQRIEHIAELIKNNSSFQIDDKQTNSFDCCSFHKPGTKKDYFFGTYLNPFSCLEYDEEPGKVYLWTEKVASEHPILELHTVYKHNGADENVSIDMFVRHIHFTVDQKMEPLTEFELGNKIFMRELSKSPTRIVGIPYIKDGLIPAPIFTFRVRKNASDKSILNALKKAEAIYDEFIPVDHSSEAYNRADFMKDTSKEHFKWRDDWKKRNSN